MQIIDAIEYLRKLNENSIQQNLNDCLNKKQALEQQLNDIEKQWFKKNRPKSGKSETRGNYLAKVTRSSGIING